MKQPVADIIEDLNLLAQMENHEVKCITLSEKLFNTFKAECNLEIAEKIRLQKFFLIDDDISEFQYNGMTIKKSITDFISVEVKPRT
jgi:hypothetical protein